MKLVNFVTIPPTIYVKIENIRPNLDINHIGSMLQTEIIQFLIFKYNLTREMVYFHVILATSFDFLSFFFFEKFIDNSIYNFLKIARFEILPRN